MSLAQDKTKVPDSVLALLIHGSAILVFLYGLSFSLPNAVRMDTTGDLGTGLLVAVYLVLCPLLAVTFLAWIGLVIPAISDRLQLSFETRRFEALGFSLLMAPLWLLIVSQIFQMVHAIAFADTIFGYDIVGLLFELAQRNQLDLIDHTPLEGYNSERMAFVLGAFTLFTWSMERGALRAILGRTTRPSLWLRIISWLGITMPLVIAVLCSLIASGRAKQAEALSCFEWEPDDADASFRDALTACERRGAGWTLPSAKQLSLFASNHHMKPGTFWSNELLASEWAAVGVASEKGPATADNGCSPSMSAWNPSSHARDKRLPWYLNKACRAFDSPWLHRGWGHMLLQRHGLYDEATKAHTLCYHPRRVCDAGPRLAYGLLRQPAAPTTKVVDFDEAIARACTASPQKSCQTLTPNAEGGGPKHAGRRLTPETRNLFEKELRKAAGNPVLRARIEATLKRLDK